MKSNRFISDHPEFGAFLKKELKLEDRMYSCICGNQMNRDENAAINICREGLRISGVELDTERKSS